MSTTSIGPPVQHANRLERFKVWCRNLKYWKTPLAVRHLCKALQTDREYARTWHANISMNLFDHTRMTATECNAAADRLMQHLFGVKKHGDDL